MDTAKFQAALIRFWWATVFPLIGSLVAWLANGSNLESVGIEEGIIVAAVSGVLYGLKKFIWPDTKF